MQQLQGVYNLQEPHFWTLCTDVYIGTLKLLVAPDADTRWILSQTHNIFTQVHVAVVAAVVTMTTRCSAAVNGRLSTGRSSAALRPDRHSCHVEAAHIPPHVGPIPFSLLLQVTSDPHSHHGTD